MAGLQNTSSNGTNQFSGDLSHDKANIYIPPDSWIHARNAINNSKTGDLGKIGNEPANELCQEAPYQIIGTIHLEADKWVIFSTNGTQSEIGLFFEEVCKYYFVVNDPCLNFKLEHLVKGVSRPTSDCVYNVYWDDGLNPSRVLSVNIEDPAGVNPYTNPNSPIPWIQTTGPAPCFDKTNTSALDCSRIRVARLINTPCIEVKKGAGGGTLLNGSYMVAIAYAIRGQKISDYYVSNIQALFNHDNSASSLDVDITSMDTRYNEIIVVLISVVNQQTVARQAGIYSTHQTRLSFDVIQDSWPSVPIEQIPIMTPVEDKTDAMYNVGQYLIRVGPTSKEDFNYQPLANQIVAKWQSVEYPADYYRKGGNKTNYLRDEVYSFFIRWVYDTGDKSASYHIPGRPKLSTTIPHPTAGLILDGGIATGQDDLESADGLTPFNWIVYNTATSITIPPTPQPDGGVLVGEGLMGYWESSENYPTDMPEVWDASHPSHPWTAPTPIPYLNTSPADYDLCGKPIRHHRFPEDHVASGANTSAIRFVSSSPNFNNQPAIRIMGVKFENVRPPVDNLGNIIPGIVGYEILRGTRNGNKTIIAKGIINNMRLYDIEGNVTARKGAYPNYPYNDLRPDPFLSVSKTSWGSSNIITGSGGGEQNAFPLQSQYSQDKFTFHSPDTNFTNPYLSGKELKIYGELNGNVTGKFEYSEKHPKEKLITDFAFTIAGITGIGLAAMAMNGKRTTTRKAPKNPGYSQAAIPGSGYTTQWTSVIYTGPVASLVTGGTAATNIRTEPEFVDNTVNLNLYSGLMSGLTSVYQTLYDNGASIPFNLIGQSNDATFIPLQTAHSTGKSAGGKALEDTEKNYNQEEGAAYNTPSWASFLIGFPLYMNYFTEGADTTIRLIKAISSYQDFALKYNSHCFYNTSKAAQSSNTRRAIEDQQYLGPQISDFGSSTRVNNLYRSRTVAVDLTNTLANPTTTEQTLFTPTSVQALGVPPPPGSFPNMNGSATGLFLKDPTKFEITSQTFPGYQIASSHYTALKQRIRNQYGQLTNIVQVPVSTCTTLLPINPATGLPVTTRTGTGILFGGDTYVGRYTEKNTFFYFYEWLYNQPDGFGSDYQAHRMLPHPRFWANFNGFETSDFTSSFIDTLTSSFSGTIVLPSSFYNLDGLVPTPSSSLSNLLQFRLMVRDAWFYLFNSGVRDFFVESEINIDLRDWGNTDTEQFYDPYRYTDLKGMFDTAIIKAGNYYKYDQSLSTARLFTNYFSWANTQSRDYSPFLAETCYVYRPRRVIYSLPAQFEGKRDNWMIYLANNYYDFLTQVTCIKPVNKSGAVIFFDSAAPVEFQGLDQLQTSLGTKLTIGDGGLFSQPMQALNNADRPHEYGSCQNRLSVINTPLGLFWISQNQGKIFQLGQGITPISDKELKWWFNLYLPYKLTQLFPNFQLTDNPVIGIACQSVYDSENGLVYFCKKDYTLKAGYTPNLTPIGTPATGPGNIQYNGGNEFIYVPTGLKIKLGDPQYFEDASWTTSYDAKKGEWLGWHDWHPELVIPSKNTFMSIVTDPVSKKGGIWRHNERCDLYCNYYGKDYPFEIEYAANTPQQINTIRSFEYYLEVYKYDTNCYDRFHVLDYNFDEAVVYNTEQCSGMLRLTPNPRPDPSLMITYPIINPTYIEILFSKVENKYRFNQFWDITNDRGEYPLYPLPPVSQQMIWNTGANGYIKTLNAANLDYNKPELQRKKFRHYTNSVFLRKRVIVGQQMRYKMLLAIANTKLLNSPR